MESIDRIGTFIGKITESVVNTTKSGLPQWVVRLETLKKWAETKEEYEFYKIEEPAYGDYPGQEGLGFFVLFGKEGQQLLNYEQAQKAVDWDGQSFDSLEDAVGKEVLFRVEEAKPYPGADGNMVQPNDPFKITWIDASDASPDRQLKTLDKDQLKSLSTKFLGTVKKTIAKPVGAKPGKPSAVGLGVLPTASVSTAKLPASKSKKTSAPTEGPPKETTQLEAWEYVNKIKGGNDDGTMADAWSAACNEIGGDREEDTFTGEDWAKIRDTIVKDLALTA